MPVRKDYAPGEFCWIDLSAHDLKSAVDWYGKVFGWTEMQAPPEGPPYTFFMQGEACIAGAGEMNDEMKGQGIPPMWNSYVATADCAATEKRAAELGATITVPTMDVPGHGKLAYFLDPGGASCALWQAAGDGQGVLVNEPVGLCWNELLCRDVAKARKFYGALFGWEFVEMPMGDATYTMIQNGGKDAGGMVAMEGEPFEGVPPHWMVYFAVEDCDGTAKKIAGGGGQVRVPPTDLPVGRFSMVADPQGAGFSIIKLSQQPE